jgi:hypothetical protein
MELKWITLRYQCVRRVAMLQKERFCRKDRDSNGRIRSPDSLALMLNPDTLQFKHGDLRSRELPEPSGIPFSLSSLPSEGRIHRKIAVASGEIVERDWEPTRCGERLTGVAADKPGTASDENGSHRSIVFSASAKQTIPGKANVCVSTVSIVCTRLSGRPKWPPRAAILPHSRDTPHSARPPNPFRQRWVLRRALVRAAVNNGQVARWKPFSSLAVPGLSAATPEPRRMRLKRRDGWWHA